MSEKETERAYPAKFEGQSIIRVITEDGDRAWVAGVFSVHGEGSQLSVELIEEIEEAQPYGDPEEGKTVRRNVEATLNLVAELLLCVDGMRVIIDG